MYEIFVLQCQYSSPLVEEYEKYIGKLHLYQMIPDRLTVKTLTGFQRLSIVYRLHTILPSTLLPLGVVLLAMNINSCTSDLEEQTMVSRAREVSN